MGRASCARTDAAKAAAAMASASAPRRESLFRFTGLVSTMVERMRGGASALERGPHLAVALGGPDARVGVLRGLVVAAGHVEGHAVVEDHPVAVLRPELGAGVAVDGVEVLARL